MNIANKYHLISAAHTGGNEQKRIPIQSYTVEIMPHLNMKTCAALHRTL